MVGQKVGDPGWGELDRGVSKLPQQLTYSSIKFAPSWIELDRGVSKLLRQLT